MISLRWRRSAEQVLVRACVAVLALLLQTGVACAIEPAQILTALGAVQQSEASFEEKRYVAALSAPVVRRGRLRYVRPSELEMVVETPVRERVRVVGNTITVETREGMRQVRLTDMPALAGWVESLRATLAGDLPALMRYFTVRASGDAGAWQLELIPLTPDLAAAVKRVAITGRGVRIGGIEVLEGSGDRSVMTLSSVADK